MTATPRTTLTDGSPVPEDGSHTRDRGDGQQTGYVVLSAEERAQGFVRPVRHSYVHVGPPRPANFRDLTPEETERYQKFGYVAFEAYGPEREPVTGRFWTARELKGGCGVVTRMGQTLAETYARDPSFYGGTFCVGCGTHHPVGPQGEFVWDGTDERVGT